MILFEFKIDKETPSQNRRERSHWREQRREVTDWCMLLRAYAGPLTTTASEKRHVHIHGFRRQRCRDEANFIGGTKALVDALVRVGLLVDDSREWATFTYEESVASKSPTKKPCTLITISTEKP